MAHSMLSWLEFHSPLIHYLPEHYNYMSTIFFLLINFFPRPKCTHRGRKSQLRLPHNLKGEKNSEIVLKVSIVYRSMYWVFTVFVGLLSAQYVYAKYTSIMKHYFIFSLCKD